MDGWLINQQVDEWLLFLVWFGCLFGILWHWYSDWKEHKERNRHV